MLEYVFYSIGILCLYIFCGIGLTLLACPKNFIRYSLYLSPFVGLTYFSYFGMIFADFSHIGSNVYAMWLLIPPIAFLLASWLIKKDRINEILWPFQKDNLALIGICIILFLSIALPFLLKVNTLTTMTIGNNDIAHYAAVSKFLTQSSFLQTQIFADSYFVTMAQTGAHFAAYFSTAIPSSIFSIATYRIETLVCNLFYVLALPIIYIIATEIFKFKRQIALIITLLFGFSAHLVYINYHGFLGQILGQGIFLSLFFVIVYCLLNCSTFSSFLPYIPLTTILIFGLTICYSPLLIVLYIPVGLFILLNYISNKARSQLAASFFFLLTTFSLSFLISPFAVFEVLQDLIIYNGIFGWDIPPLTPNAMFGLFTHNIWTTTQSSSILDWIISIPIIIVASLSLISLYKTERKLFYLSISIITFFLVFYSYLEFQEIMSPVFTGESYKAYKLFTYFIPVILLSCLSYFKNFDLFPLKIKSKRYVLLSVFLISLLAVNILCSCVVIKVNYDKNLIIDNDIVDLQKITKMDNVTSINVIIPTESLWWNQMWAYYFLFMDKPLYLENSTYYPASPMIGEWTLLPTNNSVDMYGGVASINKSQIIHINDEYILIKNFQ